MVRNFLIAITLFLVSCSPVRKYQNLPEVQAWEKDIQKFEQLDKSITYPDDAILFAGSSSIRLWETLETDMEPYSVIQRGFGGSKLSDVVVYAKRIFDPHKCSAIVLFVGNDITGSESDKSPEEVAELFRILLKIIRKTHPDNPVFWIAVTPSASRWKAWPEIKRASSLIEMICNSQKNCYFIHTDFAFLGNNGEPIDDLYRTDRLHLTAKGYAVWTKIIKNELKKVVPIY